MMEKLKPMREHELVLDYCRRCGGVWFDEGEVLALRNARPKGLGRTVTLRETAYQMPCHSCHTTVDRNALSCASCGWQNHLDCPVCQKTLERLERGDLTLDVCRSCRGVWFDNHELAQIWNMEILLDAFLWAPDLVFLSASGLAHGAGAVAGGAADVVGGGIGGVAKVAGGAVEAAGDAAGSVFEAIAEIIGSLFG
jgi:Zn-finger nucleic acid-binding protein